MLFNSLSFAAFFAIVYGLYRSLPHRSQNHLLLAASYVFYGSWDWRFLSLILASTAVDFYCGRRIHAASSRRRRRGFLLLSVAVNLGLLGVFKYFDFFASSLRALLGGFGIHVDDVTVGLVLPVGISFYTFQTMSYTIDIYRERLEPEPRFLDFALFVAFFPQLVAGPIERASRLLPQVREPRRISDSQLSNGLWLVFWGLFLKVFLADNLAGLVDEVFGAEGPVGPGRTLIAIYAFAFQIFGDFAGYSAIARGVASLMGFELMVNFRFPYFVTNPRDFWRNWHISLSTWLRDYLYISLGGNRGKAWTVFRNLFLTMLLGGLWHGAAWTFVLWGAYQGALLIGHRLIEARRRPGGSPIGGAVRVVGMFHLTCLGWLIFRARSVEQVLDLLGDLAHGFGAPSETTVRNGLMLIFFAWLPIAVQLLGRRAAEASRLSAVPPSLRVPLLALMGFLLLTWGNFGGAEFIYFQF